MGSAVYFVCSSVRVVSLFVGWLGERLECSSLNMVSLMPGTIS